MALFDVDPSRAEPLFQQLVDSVKAAVARGRLRPGDQHPSVRELARELVINPNTIAKAFRTLETDGVTYSRRGAGTFIAERRTVYSAEERERRFRERLEPLLADARHLGLTAEEARAIFETALRSFQFEEVGHE
jgi:GntR family transcriptional regulator